MELRAIQAVQIVKASERRRTNNVSETWLDLELATPSGRGDRRQQERHPEADEPFEDVAEFEVIEVSNAEPDDALQTARNHVDVVV